MDSGWDNVANGQRLFRTTLDPLRHGFDRVLFGSWGSFRFVKSSLRAKVNH